jgi:transcriptional regulator with XRE-family HTH domain
VFYQRVSRIVTSASRRFAELDRVAAERARPDASWHAARRMPPRTPAPDSPLGEYIRRQRELQKLTLRQLADLVGISNPYLSQIERGLREPSEKVLDAIAESLEVSAEGLHEQGRRRRAEKDEDGEEPAVAAAIRADPSLTARQRQALLEVYDAFTARSGVRRRSER